MKIVHAADLHLDSPMRQVQTYESVPREHFRHATRRALENLVRLCLEERASLLLIAGDLFDGNWEDYNTGLYFVGQLQRLLEGGVQVVWLRGNHDADSVLTKQVKLPENVHELSTSAPETRRFEALGVSVHGQGFRERECAVDLAAGYPSADPDMLNIGLLHSSLTGREGHDKYAPTDPTVLSRKGYDYWALGHVHAHEVVAQAPWVVYPGNLQGRHVREQGAKGAVVITVDRGRIQSAVHRALDVARWAVCQVDVSAATTRDEVLERARERLQAQVDGAEGRPVLARVALHGATRAHTALHHDVDRLEAELRAVAIGTRGAGLWLEKIQLRTRPEGLELRALAQHNEGLGALLTALESLRSSPDALEQFAKEELAELTRLLRTVGPAALEPLSPSNLAQAVEDVESTLLPRLLGEEPRP